jgi:hypothetical protein
MIAVCVLSCYSLTGCLSGGVRASGVDHYAVRQGIQCDNGDIKISLDRLRTPITILGVAGAEVEPRYKSTEHYLIPQQYLRDTENGRRIKIKAKSLVPTDLNSNAIYCPGTPIGLDPKIGEYWFNYPDIKVDIQGQQRVIEIEKKEHALWHYPYQIMLVPTFAIDVALLPVMLTIYVLTAPWHR